VASTNDGTENKNVVSEIIHPVMQSVIKKVSVIFASIIILEPPHP
jgi:hypothetical protein